MSGWPPVRAFLHFSFGGRVSISSKFLGERPSGRVLAASPGEDDIRLANFEVRQTTFLDSASEPPLFPFSVMQGIREISGEYGRPLNAIRWDRRRNSPDMKALKLMKLSGGNLLDENVGIQ